MSHPPTIFTSVFMTSDGVALIWGTPEWRLTYNRSCQANGVTVRPRRVIGYTCAFPNRIVNGPALVLHMEELASTIGFVGHRLIREYSCEFDTVHRLVIGNTRQGDMEPPIRLFGTPPLSMRMFVLNITPSGDPIEPYGLTFEPVEYYEEHRGYIRYGLPGFGLPPIDLSEEYRYIFDPITGELLRSNVVEAPD